MDSSGVGVLDKSVAVLTALQQGPLPLARLVEATGLARPTAHRLAVALEHHRLVARDGNGAFTLGPRLGELAEADPMLARIQPILTSLMTSTGESAQLFRRRGAVRVCVAAAERPSGLRDSVPLGSELPLNAGSAAKVLLAWEPQAPTHFDEQELALVRLRGWAQSVAEREPGVASVSAPVRAADSRVVAAISVSGPVERLTRQPGKLHAAVVMEAARRASDL